MFEYNKNDKQDMYRRFREGRCGRVKMYLSATEDSIEDWYYYDTPLFVGSDEWRKVETIKINYAKQLIHAEKNPQKKEMMQLLFDQGIYDFGGL